MKHLALLCALALSSACGSGNGGRTIVITWSTSELALAYAPATRTSVEVSFTSDNDLGVVGVQVTPELGPFMVVGISGDATFQAGVETTLNVVVLLTSDDQPGMFVGDIELTQGGNVIARLPVAFEIIDDTFIVGIAGGTFDGTGDVQLIVPVAALPEGAIVSVRRRDDLRAVDGHIPPLGYKPVAYTELDASGAPFLKPVDIAVPKPLDALPSDAFIVTLVDPGGKEQFVDIAEIEGDWLISRQSTLPFTGIRQSGLYIFYRALFGLNGFLTGIITDEDDSPVSGAVCALSNSPFKTTSNAAGRYACFVPHGSVTMSAVDPTTQAFASGVSFTSSTQLTNTLDLTLRPVDQTSAGGFANGDFTSGFTGWQAEGSVDVVANLGPIVPGGSGRMALLSTGSGAVEDRKSTLRQTFLMPECPAGSTILVTVKYRFVTEEYDEFSGPETKFNDQMVVTLSSVGLVEPKQLAGADVKSSAFEFVDGINFPGGDSTTGTTEWTISGQLFSKLSGMVATVEVSVEDNGDDIYDSVALIDFIQVECLPGENATPKFLCSPLYWAGKDGNERLVTNALFDHDDRERTTIIFTGATTGENATGCRAVGEGLCEYLWDKNLDGSLPDHYNRVLNRKLGTDDLYLAYDGHKGVDFRTIKHPSAPKPDGGNYEMGRTYVCATHDGWMYRLEESLHNTVIIIGSGDAEGYSTRYLHMEVPLLASGDRKSQRDTETDSEIVGLLADLPHEVRFGQSGYLVEAGQIIGISGETGSEPFPHLHFEVLNADGIPIDPFGWSGGGADPHTKAQSFLLWKNSVAFSDLTK